MEEDTPLAFVSANADDDSGGVVTYRQSPDTGQLTEERRTGTTEEMFLALDPDRNRLYTVQQTEGGLISAYRVDESTGELDRINRQSSGSSGPCYVSVDRDGRYVFAANYHGGTVAMLPIRNDGGLAEATDVVTHEAPTDDPDRDPHPHSIATGPRNEYVYVPDLGLDRVMIYRIDTENDRLRPAETPFVELHAGAGPRHFDIHPNERYVYVVNESDSTVAVFRQNHETGVLESVETVDTVPSGFDDDSYCGHISLHPSGDWLYASNRGHDSIVIFDVDAETGRLDVVDHEPTRGHWPRHFAIDRSGRYLYVENRRDDSIVPFKIDRATGELSPNGQEYEVPQPICLGFWDT